MLTACMLGHRFAVVTFSNSLVGWYRDCVELNGLANRCADIYALDLSFSDVAADKDGNSDLLVELAGKVVRDSGADSLIFGGAPLAGRAQRSRDRIPVPIIDPVGAAVKQAEALVSLRPRKATAGSFSRPAAKTTSGLSAALAARIGHGDEVARRAPRRRQAPASYSAASITRSSGVGRPCRREWLPREGNKYVCSPPPRDTASQAACWEGIEQGVFEVFSSDHCPFRYDDTGKLTPKGIGNFRYVPNGIPGIATRMPILFSEGVVKGRIDLNRFVALTSTNHAKRYGLYPRKGTIAIGSDADMCYGTRNERSPSRMLKDGCDYTPYEGMHVTGWPARTILRGNTVMRDGEIIVPAGYGTELRI